MRLDCAGVYGLKVDPLKIDAQTCRNARKLFLENASQQIQNNCDFWSILGSRKPPKNQYFGEQKQGQICSNKLVRKRSQN